MRGTVITPGMAADLAQAAEAVERIVIFDTGRDPRALRFDRARRALESLGLESLVQRIVCTGDWLECLSLLQGLDEFDHVPRTLLLADMVADGDPEVGTIGARLLRTVACDRGGPEPLSKMVWRVLWTQHVHEHVIDRIRPWAHAFVAFDHKDIDSTHLIASLPRVLGGPPAGEQRAEFGVFADVILNDRSHTAALLAKAATLLKPGKQLKRNDDIAVLGILRGDTVEAIVARLAEALADLPGVHRGEACLTPSDLLERMQGDAARARQTLIDELTPLMQDGIDTRLTANIVRHAADVIASYGDASGELCRKTLLSKAEFKLACAVTRSYKRHLAEVLREAGMVKLHSNNKDLPRQALDRALSDPLVDKACRQPALAEVMTTPWQRVGTLSHVVCVLADAKRSLDRGNDPSRLL